MALLKEWQKIAYDETKDKGTLQRFWANILIWKKEYMKNFWKSGYRSKRNRERTGGKVRSQHYGNDWFSGWNQ